jgi:carboxyl-terminal processing protease
MSQLIKFMTSKNSVPLYLILFIGVSFFAFKNLNFNAAEKKSHTVMVDGMELPESATTTLDIVPDKYEKIIRNVMLVLEELHYNPKNVNDDFSKLIFKNYLEELDYGKDIFLASDVELLKKQFETNIDEELKSKIKADFFGTAGDLYNKRLLEIEPYLKEFLSKPFDFTSNENIIVDTKKINFPKDSLERKDYWRKKLKLMVLERYNDLLNQNEKEATISTNKTNTKKVNVAAIKVDTKPTSTSNKSNETLEKEAREKVLKTITRSYEGMKKKANKDEYFKLFMNTVTQAFDPHTDYFAPVEQRSFNEDMSASYFGIGAQLKEEEGFIKIGPLTPGSPAQKNGELTVGDILVAVAQGDNEAVDISGFTTPDCVKIIRGKENTEVRVTVKKADGSIKIVKLVRKKLNLEGTLARSSVVMQGNQKIGIINLPEFYANFETPDGARCARDVAVEIEKLKAENVTGIIMDLRNNGGGSLYDVVQMVGFFIEDGPIVQVKDKDGKVSTQKDKDKSVLWNGPLAVMVNEFSASASEIFAAAIQDYHRGIILGSTTTYGKGTVQRQIPLNFENNKLLNTDEYGSIKVTLQKFYRVNGGSTQLKGVIPDIILPDVYEYLKFREKESVSAMPWDEIPKANINASSNFGFNDVIKNSNKRVEANPVFNAIKTNTVLLDKTNDKEYSLNLLTYREEQKKLKDINKNMDDQLKVRDSLQVSYLKADEEKFLKVAADKLENNKRFLQFESKDIYINEAVKVVLDMINTKTIALKN